MEGSPTAVIPSPAAERASAAPPRWPGGQGRLATPRLGASVEWLAALQFVGAVFPLAAGLLLYGWRAAGAVATVVGATYVTAKVWQRIGRRGDVIDVPWALLSALLLAMLLPAHLFATSYAADSPAGVPAAATPGAPWPILVAAGMTLVMLMWLLGGSRRAHPILLTYLVAVVLFQSMLAPQAVLHRGKLLTGDLLNATDAGPAHAKQPWIDAPPLEYHDAIRRQSVAEQLTLFTLGLEQPDRAWLSMQTLIRDRLPPLEDLIVGGQPGPIGCSSAVAVVVGGLFLLYRGLIDYRIPLLIVVSAWVALLVLPVPIVITEEGPEWRWLALRESAATWAVAISFANYELLASPLLFAAFFLATSPSIRPMARPWRAVYAILIGVTAAAMQLYVSTTTGPLVAVLAGGLATPLFDRLWRGCAPAPPLVGADSAGAAL